MIKKQLKIDASQRIYCLSSYENSSKKKGEYDQCFISPMGFRI